MLTFIDCEVFRHGKYISSSMIIKIHSQRGYWVHGHNLRQAIPRPFFLLLVIGNIYRGLHFIRTRIRHRYIVRVYCLIGVICRPAFLALKTSYLKPIVLFDLLIVFFTPLLLLIICDWVILEGYVVVEGRNWFFFTTCFCLGDAILDDDFENFRIFVESSFAFLTFFIFL